MQIARAVAGYSLAEADLLRKAIGKKKREIMVAEGEKFLSRAVEHGTPKKKAQEIWALIEPFARYGFPKAHAVAYALIAYKTAYLKAHYPVDFLAAALSAEIGSTDGIVKVIGDCTEMGIAVLPPDINESQKSFAAVGQAIRFGLAAIKGVGEQAAESILEERRKKPFVSFTDLAHRLDAKLVNKRTIDALICAGALDSLGRNRATLATAAEKVVADAARRREEAELGQTNLFGAAANETLTDHFAELPEWSLEEKLRREKDVLGFYVTGHPLSRHADEIEHFTDARVQDLPGRVDQAVRIAGVLVSVKKQKIKKGVNEGKTMLKATLEDTTGGVAVCIFASLYEKIASWIRPDFPVLVNGIVRESGGAIELTAQDVAPLEGIRERLAREMEIRINVTLADESLMDRLKELLKLHSGTTPLALRLVRPGNFEVKLKAADSIRVKPSPRLTGEVRALTGEDSVHFHF